jgi:hypothetical protein
MFLKKDEGGRAGEHSGEGEGYNRRTGSLTEGRGAGR